MNTKKSSKLNLKPAAGYIVIEPLEKEEKTSGGIYLPETAKEKPQIGLVMAVGEGEITPKGERKPMSVRVGQRVMYKKWGGNEVKIKGIEYLFAKFDDILAVVTA